MTRRIVLILVTLVAGTSLGCSGQLGEGTAGDSPAPADSAQTGDGPGSGDNAGDSATPGDGANPGDSPTGLVIPNPSGPARAFEGAEGAGANASGGRNGNVVRVTTLAASGPGSLAEAVSASDRYVVFDVCGAIDMAGATLDVNGNNITIAGETSPGGITLWNTRVMIRDQTNIVIRFLRVREVPVDLDAMLVWDSTNVAIDHCSLAGASDETLSVTGSSGDVTLSWIEIGESHNELSFHSDANMHNYGSLISVDAGAFVDIHHCLYIHHGKRCPRVTGDGRVQSVNNVIYNWANDEQKFATHVSAPSLLHVVGNTFISGADTRSRGNAEPISGIYYFSDNRWEDDNGTVQSDASAFGSAQTPLTTPQFTGATLTTTSPEQALIDLTATVGALPRDGTSQRMISELTGRTGSQGVQIASDNNTLTCHAPATDTDGDGLPDLWESAAGLSATDASDSMQLHTSGYTHLEIYALYLAEQLLSGTSNPWQL